MLQYGVHGVWIVNKRLELEMGHELSGYPEISGDGSGRFSR